MKTIKISKSFLLAIIIFISLACSFFQPSQQTNSIAVKSVPLSDVSSDSYTKIGLGRVYSTKYSPDSKTLAVATSTGVLLYDTSTYEVLKSFPDSFVDNLRWSPDSSKLAYSFQSEIKLIDFPTEKITHLEKNGIWLVGEEMSWSPDGKYLASIDSTEINGAVYIWDTTTGGLIRKIIYPEKRVFGRYISSEGVAWSPEGKYLCIVYGFTNISAPDKASDIVIWNMPSQSPTVYKQWSISNIFMEGIEWTPDGKFLILGGNPLTIFDADNGSVINKIDTQNSSRFAMSVDGTQLLMPSSMAMSNALIIPSGKTDTSLTSYTTPELEKIHEFKGRIYSPETVDISPNGKFAVAGDSFIDGFDVWDVQEQEIAKSILLESHWNDDVKFSPDSKHFVALGRDNSIRLYNTDTFSPEVEIQGANISPLDAEVYWSTDGNKVAWLGENPNGNKILQIWDKTINEKNIITDSYETPFALGVLRSNKRITRGDDEEYQVWSLTQDGEYELTGTVTPDQRFYILCSSWSPDYEKLAVCFRDLLKHDAKLIIFSPKLEPLIEINQSNIEGFYAPAWSPDGKWLATLDDTLCGAFICTGNNQVLTVRSASTMEVYFAYKIDPSKYLIAWSPDSKWLVTTGSPIKPGLTIYPIDLQLLPFQIDESTGTIESIDWSEDGKYFVATGYNGVIYLFHADQILDRFFNIENGIPSP
jgi:WD40 repeat protein